MNVKLFGHRCLVEYYRPQTKSKIVIPDAAQNQDTHRTGVVRFIGDGLNRSTGRVALSLVQEGDVVMFQINQIMEATQKLVVDSKHYMNLLQEDLIARLTGDDCRAENMEMLGDYVLLKHFVRQQPGSTLFIPDNVMKNSAPDFIYFRCLKKGSTAGDHFNPGDEVVVNFGRLTPLFVVSGQGNEEYAYTRKEWVDGVIEDSDAVAQSA